MNEDEFLKVIHRKVAQTSVGPSAIRNQGASGLVSICREYFEESIELNQFSEKLKTDNYLAYLDQLTSDLLDRFPPSGKSWGAARKGLNLFFRDVVYNQYLSEHFNISKEIVDLNKLEVPLDKDVGTGLNLEYKDLSNWKTIKDLNAQQSKCFQDKALILAEKEGIARVHLDLKFWRKVK
jgi:hypothetical protein